VVSPRKVGFDNQTLPESADDHRATQLHHVQGRHPDSLLEELGVNLTSSEDDEPSSRRPGQIVQSHPNLEVIHEPIE